MRLLSIVEWGGYPNFSALYERFGFQVDSVNSQRKARSYLKKTIPDVIVAEYNYQTDFRDRTSNLETLVAILQKYPDVKLIVFYAQEHQEKFDSFKSNANVFEALSFPVTEEKMRSVMEKL